MSKRPEQLMLEQPTTADTTICEHNLMLKQPLTLDQLTEWDLQFTREFSKEMYTRVRENARSMYVLMREILPLFDLLVEKSERAENGDRSLKGRTARAVHIEDARAADVLSEGQSDRHTDSPKTNTEKILPRVYQQNKIIANRRNRQ